jgi:hypothetical protein
MFLAASVRGSNTSQPSTRTKPTYSIRTATAGDHAVPGKPAGQHPMRVLARYKVPADGDRNHLRREPEPGERRPLDGWTGGSRSTHRPSIRGQAHCHRRAPRMQQTRRR